jgi:hypothetical protein
MMWIETVSKVEATGQLPNVYAGICQRCRSMANILGSASPHPPVMQALINLYQPLHGLELLGGVSRQSPRDTGVA